MSVDVFSKKDAITLLHKKEVLFFGDSNVRAFYKDLVWLLQYGTLIPKLSLKRKNEESFADDVRISNGRLMNSRNYEEIREYNKEVLLRFEFLTRLYLPKFIEYMENLDEVPDVIVMNSCLWDLTRWGPDGVKQFKANLKNTFTFLRNRFPNTRLIWLTSLPPSSTASRGSLITPEISFLRKLLPFHILEANNYAASIAEEYHVDILDLHYHMRLMIHDRSPDGIHWEPVSVRYITNLLLTHLALCMEQPLPRNEVLDDIFLQRSEVIYSPKVINNRKPFIIKRDPSVPPVQYNNKVGKKASKKKKMKKFFNKSIQFAQQAVQRCGQRFVDNHFKKRIRTYLTGSYL